MKILYRIMDICCHPSRIVFYFKDKVFVVLIHLLVFMSMAVGVTAALAYSGNYINRSASEGIARTIFESNKVKDAEYKDYKLTGDSSVITYEAYKIYINRTKDTTTTYFVLEFHENTVSGYFGNELLFTEEYKSLPKNYEFKLFDLKNGTNDKRYDFVNFMDTYLTKFEPYYETQVFLGGIIEIAQFYAILLVVLFIFTYLVNPTIKFEVRARLLIYDSLIFFFIFSLAYIFNLEFLKYLAVIVSTIYANITFRHIIRVNKNGKY